MSEQHSTSHLPSTYDKSLPASIRGEAVRSAIRSERGVCLDFTSPIYPQINVGVVQVTGKGTLDFLNNKLTNSFTTKALTEAKVFSIDERELKIERGVVGEACLLTSRGFMIDRLLVATFLRSNNDGNGMEANLVTSPGHAGSALFKRMDPYIFPLDGVNLVDMTPTEPKSPTTTSTKVFTLVAKTLETAQSAIRKQILPFTNDICTESLFAFPQNREECLRYTSTKDGVEEKQFTVLEHSFLSDCVCKGYTFILTERLNGASSVATQTWNHMVAENNDEGPLELGSLEYETLRIEGGQPGFGQEISIDDHAKYLGEEKKIQSTGKVNLKTKANPLELHLRPLVDEQKGCYMGQEGIASILKNKRGVPRILYSVIFKDEDNFYNDEEGDGEDYSNGSQSFSNKTFLPEVGDDLYVLGSNEQIKVGCLTSVAEPGGTSSPETVALALVRRSDSILNKMKAMNLEIDMRRDFNDPLHDDAASQPYESNFKGGIIPPPPLDPLDGLEVAIGGSFTQGVLRAIAPRRFLGGKTLFEVDEWSTADNMSEPTGTVMGLIPVETDRAVVDTTENESYVSKAAVDKVASPDDLIEAKRKAEKLEEMQRRTEEAIAARKQKKEENKAKTNELMNNKEDDPTEKEAERKRKAEKIEMLQKRAKAAMEARKQKK